MRFEYVVIGNPSPFVVASLAPKPVRATSRPTTGPSATPKDQRGKSPKSRTGTDGSFTYKSHSHYWSVVASNFRVSWISRSLSLCWGSESFFYIMYCKLGSGSVSVLNMCHKSNTPLFKSQRSKIIFNAVLRFSLGFRGLIIVWSKERQASFFCFLIWNILSTSFFFKKLMIESWSQNHTQIPVLIASYIQKLSEISQTRICNHVILCGSESAAPQVPPYFSLL